MSDVWGDLSLDWLMDNYPEAVPIIDALVAERDEWRLKWHEESGRAAQADSDRDEAEAERDWARAENSRLRGQLSEIAHTNAPVIRDLGARAEAAEARVTELEAEMDGLRAIVRVAHDVIIQTPPHVQKEFLEGISRATAALAKEDTDDPYDAGEDFIAAVDP